MNCRTSGFLAALALLSSEPAMAFGWAELLAPPDPASSTVHMEQVGSSEPDVATSIDKPPAGAPPPLEVSVVLSRIGCGLYWSVDAEADGDSAVAQPRPTPMLLFQDVLNSAATPGCGLDVPAPKGGGFNWTYMPETVENAELSTPGGQDFGNLLAAVQVGWTAFMSQHQIGTMHDSFGVQAGDGNFLTVFQGDNGNISTVAQFGFDNVAVVQQD